MQALYLEQKQADKGKFMRYNTSVMSAYMWVLILSGAVPIIFSFWPTLHFYRHRAALIVTLSWVFGVFFPWDVWATWRGHWRFAPEGVWPVRIINLPLEEVLFFVVIPFCCIFSWEVILYFMGKRQKGGIL